MRHATCDMWHVTCDMRHVTCDMRVSVSREFSPLQIQPIQSRPIYQNIDWRTLLLGVQSRGWIGVGVVCITWSPRGLSPRGGGRGLGDGGCRWVQKSHIFKNLKIKFCSNCINSRWIPYIQLFSHIPHPWADPHPQGRPNPPCAKIYTFNWALSISVEIETLDKKLDLEGKSTFLCVRITRLLAAEMRYTPCNGFLS